MNYYTNVFVTFLLLNAVLIIWCLSYGNIAGVVINFIVGVYNTALAIISWKHARNNNR